MKTALVETAALRSRRRPSRLAAVMLLLPLWACVAGKQELKPDKPVAGGQAGRAAGSKEDVPEISVKAKLLFEDALKAHDAQKRTRAFDYPQLERKFQQALDADGRLAEAEYNLGVLAERQGKIDEAIGRYKGALSRKPSLKEAAQNLAVIAQNRGDTREATALYEDVLARHPDDALSRARLAEIARQAGDHERAMELARQALMRDPKALAAYKVMMLSYLDRKQHAMAKLVALRAMKLDEADPELYYTVGLVLLHQGEAFKARLQFKRALEVRPDYQPAHLELARLALASENFLMAEEHLRKLLQANGKSAELHLNLGVTYKGLGQYDKAMQEYELAEKLDPKLAATYLNRAVILHRHKDAPERAIELYKKYIQLADLPADAPVFALVKEAEQIVQAKAEAAKMEAEALKAAEEQAKKEQEANAKQGPEGGKAPEAAPAPPPAVAKPAQEEGGDEPPDAM